MGDSRRPDNVCGVRDRRGSQHCFAHGSLNDTDLGRAALGRSEINLIPDLAPRFSRARVKLPVRVQAVEAGVSPADLNPV